MRPTWLVGGWATPLKQMISSVGMIWNPCFFGKNMFQNTNQMRLNMANLCESLWWLIMDKKHDHIHRFMIQPRLTEFLDKVSFEIRVSHDRWNLSEYMRECRYKQQKWNGIFFFAAHIMASNLYCFKYSNLATTVVSRPRRGLLSALPEEQLRRPEACDVSPMANFSPVRKPTYWGFHKWGYPQMVGL